MTVTERFLKYVTFETTSDESSDTVPSTATQLVLADYLVEELRGAGVTDAMRDEMGYVYGHIPASDGCEKLPEDRARLAYGYFARCQRRECQAADNQI